MKTSKPELKQSERDAIVQALRAGVVPRRGLSHIQVGRAREVEELIRDIERISDGGATIRFVIGDYGSGKTFFLNLVRLVALEKGLAVMFADLAPDRRLHATGGQARRLYAEMARNLSTRTKSDGGALPGVMERFIDQARRDAEANDLPTETVIRDRLAHFEEFTGGYDFAEVVRRYSEGLEQGDDDLKSAALRWLRGEHSTKSEARKDLGVRTIVDDGSVYDHLKLMAAFVRAAGYKGLLVGFDEMVNLFRLTSPQARNSNFEQILRILNDVHQGTAEHIGFVMGGTSKFLMDTRRGLFSYEALKSRLEENGFARNGLVDLSGPIVRLANLTEEEFLVLLENVRAVMCDDPSILPDAALRAFMAHCSQRVCEVYFRTPRNVVKAFVDMVAVLQQNPETAWSDLIQEIEIAPDESEDMADVDPDTGDAPLDDELARFQF